MYYYFYRNCIDKAYDRCYCMLVRSSKKMSDLNKNNVKETEK